jgi:3-oxoacyl-(acyl-carrier-protein) synthase
MIMTENKKQRRVVVTGVGVIAPNGIGKETFWTNAMAGVSGIDNVDFAKEFRLQSQVAACAKDFDPKACDLNDEEIERFDRYVQFALAASIEAMNEAQVKNAYAPRRMGVSIATAICGTRHMEQSFLNMTARGAETLDPSLRDPYLFLASTFNVASAAVAARFHLQGVCVSLPTGCAAGLDAIGFAFDAIARGEVDLMVTGASEAPVSPMVMASFDVIGATSSRKHASPKQASRPYDKLRDGFVLGEGCGILILEERAAALKRGAKILAEIKGYGSTSNAYHMTSLPEDGEDLARAITIALEDANVSTDDIQYISAHGSSTPQNDANETAAYKKVFGARAYDIPISSMKSMCGHALAAANAIEAVACVCSLESQMIHPTINYEDPDPVCDLDYVPNEGRRHAMRHVLKNASGFSGIHSAVIFASGEVL